MVDVYANGDELLTDFKPGTLTNPMALPPGDYDLKVVAVGDEQPQPVHVGPRELGEHAPVVIRGAAEVELEVERVPASVEVLVQLAAQPVDRSRTAEDARPVLASVEELLRAADRLVELLPARVVHRVVPRPLDTEGATRRIEAMLSEHEQVTLEALLGEHPSITDVISLLIALLELARVGAISLSQPVPFGPIVVFRATAHEAA